MKIKFGELALLFAFGILLSAVWSNVAVYAQNKTATSVAASTSSATPEQHVAKVKIISPTKGQQVQIGKDLTISGTSIDNNATSNNNDCKVSVIANKVRPYQPTTATGPGGAADYSKWKFDITSKYTTIKPGQNRITAKYECANNAALTSYSSVNVTGVSSNGTAAIAATANTSSPATTGVETTKSATNIKPVVTTAPPAKTTTASAAAVKQQQQQHPVATNSNNPASSVSNNAEVQKVAPVSSVNNKPLSSTSTVAPQVKVINQPQQQPKQTVTASNNSDGESSKLVPPSPVIASDKMMYFGYHAPITNDLTEKNAMGPKSATRVSSTDSTTDNDSTNKGSIDIKYRHHDITTNNNVSISQVNIKRNTDNINNNFIFPFSIP